MSKLAISVVFFLFYLAVPSYVFAWGPITHIYLGTEVFFLSSVLPAGIYGLLKKYRSDFLYGNLMADFILGKKYLPPKKNPHNWDVGLRLLESANTHSEKAFSYGYLSHLAADTVAHDTYTRGVRNMEHTFLELRADSVVDRKYWVQAVNIERKVQKRNDLFLERSSPRMVIFSFKANKRIFKGMVILSGLNKEKLGAFIDRNLIISPASKKENIQRLHEESLDRIIDVLQNGQKSEVLKKDPIGVHRRGRIIKSLTG